MSELTNRSVGSWKLKKSKKRKEKLRKSMVRFGDKDYRVTSWDCEVI